MCDVLVALPGATAGAALFAKNSDRPPGERQVVVWNPARDDRGGATRATFVDVPAHPGMTFAGVLSRPAWCWGAEHGVNEAGVATTPGIDFDPINGRHCVRFSFAGSTADMAEACERLALWKK